MEQNQPHPTPDAIMQIGMGFWPSKVLLTAVSENLFTQLAVSPKTLEQLKKILGWNCTDRHAADFLDTLVALNFLTRKGDGDSAVYSNASDTDFFLDKAKPAYIGGMLEMANNRLFKFWNNLGVAMHTGELQNEAAGGGGNPFEQLYDSPELLREFVNAMTGIQMGNFMALAAKFNFSKYKTLCDIGGSGAMLSIQVASKYPHISCISADLPPVEQIARENISHFNLGDRIKTKNIDFFKDDFPEADVIVMGNILHDWNEEIKEMLIQKAFAALPAGGAFIAIENVIDNERRKNVFGLTMSLNMLIETGEGFDYTFDDFDKWTGNAGFSSTEFISLTGPSSAAIAYK